MNDTQPVAPTATPGEIPDADRGDDFYVKIVAGIQAKIDKARASRNQAEATRKTMEALTDGR